MNVSNSSSVSVSSLANVHSHLREGPVLGPLIEQVIAGGADVILPMPNTTAGLCTSEQVLEYIKTAISLVPSESDVAFIPTAMITERTTPEAVYECVTAGIFDFKVYPRQRTTKSENGVRNYGRVLAMIKEAANAALATYGVRIKVHFHPEHPSMAFSNRDAELAFLPILYMFVEETEATIISEHGTDARCIPHWKNLAESRRFYVTLTAHHLLTTEDLTFGDVRCVCKPPIKLESDRTALVDLIAKDLPWVMAGPDDAPHDRHSKHVEQGCCACGAYTAPFLLPLYAHALDGLFQTREGVSIFVNFTSRNARNLHDLPVPSREIVLVRKPFRIPDIYQVGDWTVEPFWAGKTIDWSFADHIDQ